ncbi:MAG TPA: ATP-binding protein [Allosphingosinicella sp.]|nr:ATP-binding protein [Allosphingosinicella sp.]
MRRLLPRSLIGQMALLIGIALLVAQLANFALTLSDRQKLSLARNEGPAITRYASVAADVAGAQPDFRRPLVADASRRGAQFRLEPQSAVAADAARAPEVEGRVRDSLASNGIAASDVRAVYAEPRGGRARDIRILQISANLGGAGWLNARLATPRPDPWLAVRLGVATLFLYLIVLGATLLLAIRMARPLRDLTEAADRFGGREAPLEVAPRGPGDLRRAIEAFNAMNRRLVSLLDEKDRMLGAIGHDLRTPLASLRIRAEAVEDEEERARMAATIDEMAAMLEDILILARSGRSREERRPVDLAALADAMVEEFRDLGADAEMAESPRQVAEVQPNLVRRAVRNLIDNAIKYGGSARVSVRREGEEIIVEVRDHGPGLPQDELVRAAEPFHRGEASRSRETGGTGLGLAITRAVAEGHGGALRLANGEREGLIATLVLPAPPR